MIAIDCLDGNRPKLTLFSIVIYWYWFFSALFFLGFNWYKYIQSITYDYRQFQNKNIWNGVNQEQTRVSIKRVKSMNASKSKEEWVKLSKPRAKTRVMKAARSGMYWNMKWSWWNQNWLSKQLCWKDLISKLIKHITRMYLDPFFFPCKPSSGV